MLQGKNIFITGGAGFIANMLIEKYVEHNYITVYDNFHRDTLSNSNIANHPHIDIIRGDVLDFELLLESMDKAQTNIVIHTAAIAGIDTVLKNPVLTMRVNMMGTANALEAARICNIKDRFIDFSTSEVFGSRAFHCKESDNTIAQSVGHARWTYAVSKLAGEHLAHSYYTTYNLPVVIIRPFNIYGPGQTGEGAMQVFISKALANEDIFINGTGNQIRAWCYVDDFVRCLVKCVENSQAIGHSFNIGNPRAVITSLGLAQTVCRVLKSESKILFRKALSADIELRVPDTKKAFELLNFQSKIDLEEGIRETAKWMRGY